MRTDKNNMEPSLFVIFGATGDLSRRKLLPALARLDESSQLHERFNILAVGRYCLDENVFRATVCDTLQQAGISAERSLSFVARIHYQPIFEGNDGDYQELAKRLTELDKLFDIPHNHAFYLALPPQALSSTVAGLAAAKLNRNSQGWTRLVVEKPFGRDFISAQALNKLIHEHFDESQIYRIDHYLGKTTVQNLLVFRLANAFIESSWNRDRIDAVQITVGEEIGVDRRAEYYNSTGALRDMVQNHLTQLLTLVAMDTPASFSADAIRNEKIKVLNSIRPITTANAILGQYTAGEMRGKAIKGYLQESGIPADSQTETFIALKLYIDSWRWQGVPFYLRTGKRMPHKLSQIAVRFREAPIKFFEQYGCAGATSNVLIINLQPDEGFSFFFSIKRPGTTLGLERIPLRFQYADHFNGGIPDSYQALLLDILIGDQSLFVHWKEVEESWRIYTPVIDHPQKVNLYPAGTWGPMEANVFSISECALEMGCKTCA